MHQLTLTVFADLPIRSPISPTVIFLFPFRFVLELFAAFPFLSFICHFLPVLPLFLFLLLSMTLVSTRSLSLSPSFCFFLDVMDRFACFTLLRSFYYRHFSACPILILQDDFNGS